MTDFIKVLFVIVSAFYILSFGKIVLQMLQINLYNENNRYLKWIFKEKKEVFFKIDFFTIPLGIAVLLTEKEYLINYLISLCTILLIISLNTFYKNILSKQQNKKPLVITKRVKRLIFTIAIFLLINYYFFLFQNFKVSFLLILLSTYFIYFLVYLGNVVNKPFEKLVFYYYYTKAQKKLKSIPNLKVVGITGSYGKTSCKNILNDILKEKYISLSSPKSINTLNGLMININGRLSKFDEIYIAEMGAFIRGEIKSLCHFVRPQYGIVTNVGLAHLETFKTEENILKAKLELIESLPKEGVGILNKDSKPLREGKLNTAARIVWIGIDEKADIMAKNIKMNSNGLEFEVVTGKETFPISTKLLGKHNVYNILSSIALALEFGMKIKDIQNAISSLKPTPHRLEIKKIFNFYQIDDSYNSNPSGSKSALEVLSMFKGYRVVVTPGMVELAEKEEELNFEFGKNIATISRAELVILVGNKKTEPIYKGLTNKGYPKEKIIVINDVRKAFDIISKIETNEEIFALFENDLPDNYTEKE